MIRQSAVKRYPENRYAKGAVEYCAIVEDGRIEFSMLKLGKKIRFKLIEFITC